MGQVEIVNHNANAAPPRRWSTPLIALHWLMVLLIFFQWAGGFFMTHFMPNAVQRFETTQTHKSFGFVLLALMLGRLLYRVLSRQPHHPLSVSSQESPAMRAFENVAARAVVLIFYAMLMALPISGWIMASSNPLKIPTFFFDLFEIPAIAGADAELMKRARLMHEVFSKILLGTVFLHIAAALKHHFWNKDDVLKSMWFSKKPASERSFFREITVKNVALQDETLDKVVVTMQGYTMQEFTFVITEPAILDGTKTVSRRWNCPPIAVGERVLAVRKASNPVTGEKADAFAVLRVISVREELLAAATDAECLLEGFPQFNRESFIAFMLQSAPRGADENSRLTRVEFEVIARL